MQAQFRTAEEGQKKLELQLSELQPHAASLEERLKDIQSKLKAAETELASVRADLAQTKVCADSRSALFRLRYILCQQVAKTPCLSFLQASKRIAITCRHSELATSIQGHNRHIHFH